MNRLSVNWLLGLFCAFALIVPTAFAYEEHVDFETEPVQYRFTVDDTKTIIEMIGAGQYDWVDRDIHPGDFLLLKGEGKEEIIAELARFDLDMSSDDVLAELDHRNLRPATFVELLAFGAAFPEEQEKSRIVALGSVMKVDGNLFVFILTTMVSEYRVLYLSLWRSDWLDDDRFLAVRK